MNLCQISTHFQERPQLTAFLWYNTMVSSGDLYCNIDASTSFFIYDRVW